MSTNDCSIIGRSSCICGRGEITVEHCVPDHAYVREGQGWFNNSIECAECALKYAFFNRNDNNHTKARLVPKQDAQRITDATKNWHETLREIERSEQFHNLSARLEETLAQQKSAAAAHRLLVGAKLTYDSIGQYRSRGYKLSALHAEKALHFFRERDPELEAMIERERNYRQEMDRIPVAVPTGNPGLEC